MRPHDCAGTAFLLAYTLQAERHESESMAHARGRLTGGLRWLAAVGGCSFATPLQSTRARAYVALRPNRQRCPEQSRACNGINSRRQGHARPPVTLYAVLYAR